MYARHLNHIGRAANIAQQSDHVKWNLGAVIARGNRVVSTAPNKFRNAPFIDHENATVHAEANAIKAAGNRDLRGATIYVARVNKTGLTNLARPCKNCMHAIVEAGIKEIVYTNDVGGISEERIML